MKRTNNYLFSQLLIIFLFANYSFAQDHSNDQSHELVTESKNTELPEPEPTQMLPAAESVKEQYSEPLSDEEGIVPETVKEEKKRSFDIAVTDNVNKHERRKKARNFLRIVKKQKKKLGNNGWGSAGVLLVILCIFLPWLAVGIYTGFDVKLTLLTLLLWILGWLPGVIFGLLVLFDVVV